MASGIFVFQRQFLSLPANGASVIPLVGNNNQIFTGPALSDTIRSRVSVFGYVTAQGAGPGIRLQWWQDVIFQVALWWDNSAVVPATSPTPIATLDPSPNYLFSNALEPRMDVFDIATPHENVSWRPPEGIIDVSAKRKTTNATPPTVWLAYEVFDNSGIINTTTAGVTYSLGLHAAIEQLWELQ